MPQPLAAYSGDAPYIFVSYSHSDTAIVHPEIRRLQDQGFNVWWDEGITPGAAWRHELAEALRDCSLIVFLVTPNSVVSQHCVREINFGLDEYRRPVLAVHLLETKLPDALGLSLSDRQAILKHALGAQEYERKLDAVIAEALARPSPAPTASYARNRLRRYARPALALALLILVVAGIVSTLPSLLSQQTATPTHATFRITAPPGANLHASLDRSVAIGEQGTVYFVSGEGSRQRRLYMRPLAALDPVPVPGVVAEEGETLEAIFPSPDGRELLLFFATQDGGVIKRVPAQGGRTVALADTEDSFALRLHWGDDNRVFYRDAGKIWETNREFATRQLVLEPNEEFNVVSRPFFSRSKNALYFVRANLEAGIRTRPSQIHMLSLASGVERQIVQGSSPHVTETGLLVFMSSDNTVSAARLDASGSSILDRIDDVLEVDAGASGYGTGFTLSQTGHLVYRLLDAYTQAKQLRWLQRSGAQLTIGLPAQPIFHAQLSPDQRHIAYVQGIDGSDLWTYSLQDRLQTRITNNGALAFSPRWSPDGKSIAYTSWQHGKGVTTIADINLRNETLFHEPEAATAMSMSGPNFWSRRSGIGLIACIRPVEGCDVILPATAGGDKLRTLGKTGFNERLPTLSPAEDYLAYLSDEFGTDRIIIRPYPRFEQRYRQVPLEGCTNLEWIDNEIIAECQQRIYSVPVSMAEDNLNIGKPVVLADLEPGTRFADAQPDGQRFLLIANDESRKEQLIVALNWLHQVEAKLQRDGSAQ